MKYRSSRSDWISCAHYAYKGRMYYLL